MQIWCKEKKPVSKLSVLVEKNYITNIVWLAKLSRGPASCVKYVAFNFILITKYFLQCAHTFIMWHFNLFPRLLRNYDFKIVSWFFSVSYILLSSFCSLFFFPTTSKQPLVECGCCSCHMQRRLSVIANRSSYWIEKMGPSKKNMSWLWAARIILHEVHESPFVTRLGQILYMDFFKEIISANFRDWGQA